MRRLLTRGLGEIPLGASGQQIDSLCELASLVCAWNRRFNLSGYRQAEWIVRRLILDAAALLSVLPEPPGIVDLGSGAGFPGLPFAILRPNSRVLLVEARERRHHFQRAAIRQLLLANVSACRGRVEKLDAEPFPLAVAQALAPARVVLQWILPWVEVGGLMVIPGGQQPPDPGSDPRVKDVRIARYRVPLGGPRRTLWTARRAC